MKCQPSNTPSGDEIDIPKLRERYRIEREKRLRDGQSQYTRLTGKLKTDHVTDPHQPRQERAPISEEIDVVVLGAGFGGLLAGYHLAKAGVTSMRNIDAAGDFGGVWYWNRYPGIQCDNESYCYLPLLEETGFMPSKRFADGTEIQRYCRQIAEHVGLHKKALFHTQITALRWDEPSRRWLVGTNRGDDIRARFVVMACGVLNMPKLPGVAGIETFKGKMFHTARWDYDYTGGSYDNPTLDKLKDKRVGFIGTGATAIQAVPYLGKYAKQLYVIQRTPACVDARPNPATDQSWLKSLKPGWQAERQANFHRGAMEQFRKGETDLVCDFWTEINRNMEFKMAALGWPEMPLDKYMEMREVEDFLVMERLRRRVDDAVQDPQIAEALKPYYHFMCKRPLSSDEFYPTFNRPNVELIDVADTKGVERMTERGFVANGKEYEVDCMIFASGFEVTSDLDRRWSVDVVEGRGGRSIYEHWADGPVTLHGMSTHGFPNQFYIGYIQGGINASVTEHFGRQGYHIAYIIAEALKRGATLVEANKEAQDAYVRRFEELEFDTSDFQSRCTPSYFNNEGENKPNWRLFRAWGLGWDAFEAMLQEWRERGEMEGLDVSK